MVDVVLAKPWIIETDKSVIHTWDYGHQHRKAFDVFPDHQIPVEDTIEYD